MGKASIFVTAGLVAGLALGAVVGVAAASGLRDPGVLPPGPVTGASPSPAVAPSVAPSPARTASSGVPAMARAALAQSVELHVRLADDRADLAAHLDRSNLDVGAVARLLRSVVTNAGQGAGLTPRLAEWSAAHSLAGEVGTFYDAVRDAGREGLRASLANEAAYRAAGTSVVELLDRLPALDARARELAANAGVEVMPLPAVAP